MMTITKSNAVDLSAKLLATENISVRRARAQTASFDTKSRVLTLPMWKDLTPEIEDMLVGHEVGHALFTTDEYFEPIQEDRRIMQYLNVLEDVRIEKLIKRKYPGLRKKMAEGYRQLNEKDFFGVGKIQNMASLNLIDRINLYFKAGFNCGVKFTPEEKVFVNRAESAETVDEIINLAKEIYGHSRQSIEKKLTEAFMQEPEMFEEEYVDPDDVLDEDQDFSNNWDTSDMDDSDAKSDDDDAQNENDKKEQSLGPSKDEQQEQKIEEELESKTADTFNKKLEELADDATEFNYFTLDENFIENPVVSYKTILLETSDTDVYGDDPAETAFKQKIDTEFVKFKTESSRVVNYLIKEFEMRKSATMYKRAQTSKIGALDMRKVWSYKLNDDLFKRVTTIPQGKNHGMLFLLDWSGSMQHVIKDTVQQVIQLAMFCNRAQIPYQVLAFTSDYDHTKNMTYDQKTEHYKKSGDYKATLADTVLNNGTSSFGLLELFSNKMSTVEFNLMSRRLNNFWKFQRNSGYGLGGTPLNEALSFMVPYIGKYIKSNNIEKMSLITLTDGMGGSLYPNNRYALEEYRYEYDETRSYSSRKKVNIKNYLTDKVTKKSYQISRDGSVQTAAILRMIKDRYNVNSVGFYICRNTRRDLESAVVHNVPGFNGSMFLTIEDMRKEFRDSGFASLKNTGRDDLFIVPQTSMKIEDGELEIVEKHTAKQIASRFTKMMSGKKTSRVLLNQFIGYVA